MNREVLELARLRTQLQYLSVRRMLLSVEVLLFLIQLTLQLYVYMDPVFRLFFVLLGILRLVTETLNYNDLAKRADLSEQWTILWPMK